MQRPRGGGWAGSGGATGLEGGEGGGGTPATTTMRGGGRDGVAPWTRFSADRRPGKEERRAYGPPPTERTWGPLKAMMIGGMGLRGYIVSEKPRVVIGLDG